MGLNAGVWEALFLSFYELTSWRLCFKYFKKPFDSSTPNKSIVWLLSSSQQHHIDKSNGVLWRHYIVFLVYPFWFRKELNVHFACLIPKYQFSSNPSLPSIRLITASSTPSSPLLPEWDRKEGSLHRSSLLWCWKLVGSVPYTQGKKQSGPDCCELISPNPAKRHSK